MMSPLSLRMAYFEFSVRSAMSSMSVSVLTIMPPAPASTHSRIISGLLVGSMEATTTGFLNATPQNSVLRLATNVSPGGRDRDERAIHRLVRQGGMVFNQGA